MTIITGIKTFLQTYSGLKADAPMWVNKLGPDATEYNIVPLAGDKVIENYLSGKSLREFPFAFQTMEITAEELERLENIGFFEAYSDWLEAQTLAGNLPSLGAKKTAEKIEATGQGYLYQEGESKKGIYQIQCKVTYEKAP